MKNHNKKTTDKKRFLNLIQVILFCVILSCGAGLLITGFVEGKTTSSLEKRELTAWPELNAADVFSGKYGDIFSDALADHIYGRDFFVTAKTYAQIALGKRLIDGIYIDGERLIETYKDEDFDDKQISKNITALAGFMTGFAGRLGSEHVKLMLIPGKSAVYRGDIPWYYPMSGKPNELKGSVIRELKNLISKGGVMQQGDEDTDDNDSDADEDGFDFGEGDPDADGKDADEDEFNFDEGDPDKGKNSVDEEDFNFDEGDPDKSEKSADEEDFNFDEGDPDKDKMSSDGEEGADNDIDKDSDLSDSAEKKESGDDKNNASEPDDANSSKLSVNDAEKMILDLRPVMAQHKDEYIYYNTDHHWTTLGARYAYIEYMKNTFSNEKEETVASDFLGTDYNKIHYYKTKDIIKKYEIPEADGATMEISDSGDLKKVNSIYDEKSLQTDDKYNYFLSGNYTRITIDTNAQTDKKLLLIKDSFSNSMLPFLCKDYKQIIMIDLRYVNSGVLGTLPEDWMPDDVLIAYNEEKFMQDTHQEQLMS